MPPVPRSCRRLERSQIPGMPSSGAAGGPFTTLGNFGGFLPTFYFFPVLFFFFLVFSGLVFRSGSWENSLEWAWNGALVLPAVLGREKKSEKSFGRGEFQDYLHWGGHRDHEDSAWEHPAG